MRVMSDGNFNRSLLPYNNYQSGLRAGKAQMRKIAVDAFRSWLTKEHPDMDQKLLDQKVLEYKMMIE